MKSHVLTLSASALVLGLATGLAQAVPLTTSGAGLKAAIEELNPVQHVDGCNRVCRKGAVEEWGGAVRWHRHVGKVCRPVHCSP